MPPCERVSALTADDTLTTRLTSAPLDVLGRVLDASNAAFLAALDDGADPVRHVIYKPIVGERPLWDFPDGHLAHREVATALVAAAGGWDCIPPTVLRTRPAGLGSVQLWVTPLPPQPWNDGADTGRSSRTAGEAAAAPGEAVEVDDEPDEEDLADLADLAEEADLGLLSDDADPAYVGLFAPDAVEPPWLPVLTGELGDGMPVVVAHRDAPELRSLAVLDAVLNNSDRKGSHLLVGGDGRLWGIDHGLTFHAEDKMRTVLWGWAGETIPEADRARLERLDRQLARPDDGALCAALDELLTVDEIEALRARVRRLSRSGRHPRPDHAWPAVPWPPL